MLCERFEVCSVADPINHHRKMSEPPYITQLRAATDDNDNNNDNNPLMKPKPCLKRRCSVPLRREITIGSSCDSLDNSSIVSTDSSSFGSKKSVSFADSVGEDLCHIKLFTKEISEFLVEDSWPAKMWRWQKMMTLGQVEESSNAGKAADDWYIDSDTDDEEQCQNKISSDFSSSSHDDHLEDDPIYFTRIPSIDEEDEDLASHVDKGLSMVTNSSEEIPSSTSSSTVIVPTFLPPQDLPEYKTNLATRGIGLESVTVIPEQCMISGTIAIAIPKDSSNSRKPKVFVEYSFDNWATSNTVNATSFKAGERYGFVIGTKRMEAGDDLELLVRSKWTAKKSCDLEQEGEDNNGGLNYRFICKNKSKFSPGKSLW